MKQKIPTFVDPDQMFAEIEQIALNCNCSILEAVEEYSRVKNIDIDVTAAMMKSHRGSLKQKLIRECTDLKLLK